MIQGYFTIDKIEMTEEEKTEFEKVMKSYSIYYRLIKSGNKDFYHAVIGNSENITILLDILKTRNPEILGVWNMDGTELGTGFILDEDGNQLEVDGIPTGERGDPTYPYQKTKTEGYLNDIDTYDEQGNITGTVGKLHQTFAGFKVPESFSGT